MVRGHWHTTNCERLLMFRALFNPHDPFNQICFVGFVLGLILLLAALATGEEIVVPLTESTDTLAISALVEQFDSPDLIIRTDADGCMMTTIPAFACYAEACAKLDGAPLAMAKVLCGKSGYSEQSRTAAAVALEAIGPEAMVAEPTLRRLLASPQMRDNIMALAIIRGIGSDAESLLGPVRTLLHAENLHVAYWACRAVAAMGHQGEPAVADLCLLLMSDEPASVRRNACIALGAAAPGSENLDVAIRVLAEVLVLDFVHPVRVEAEGALKKIFSQQK